MHTVDNIIGIYVFLCLVTLFAGQSVADDCPTFCTFDYTPVCGEVAGRQQTFANACAMGVTKCQTKEGEYCGPIPVDLGNVTIISILVLLFASQTGS